MPQPPVNMSQPAGRECRCEGCGLVQWVNGPIAPPVGLVCDVCRSDPCPKCGGQMLPVHSYVLEQFHAGASNSPHAVAASLGGVG